MFFVNIGFGNSDKGLNAPVTLCRGSCKAGINRDNSINSDYIFMKTLRIGCTDDLVS